MISYECALDGCTGRTPIWSCLCDLHRERLRTGARLTDGVQVKAPGKAARRLPHLGPLSRSAPAKITPEAIARGKLRRQIEDRDEARRLADDLTDL